MTQTESSPFLWVNTEWCAPTHFLHTRPASVGWLPVVINYPSANCISLKAFCPDNPGRSVWLQFAICVSDISILIGQLLLLLLTCCALLKSTGGWISVLGEGINRVRESSSQTRGALQGKAGIRGHSHHILTFRLSSSANPYQACPEMWYFQWGWRKKCQTS